MFGLELEEMKFITLILLALSSQAQAFDTDRLCCSEGLTAKELWNNQNYSERFDEVLMDLIQHDPDHRQDYLPFRLEGESLIQWCDWHSNSTCDANARPKRASGLFSQMGRTRVEAAPALANFLADFFHEHGVNWIQFFIHQSDIKGLQDKNKLTILSQWLAVKDIGVQVTVFAEDDHEYRRPKLVRSTGVVVLSDISKMTELLSYYEEYNAMSSEIVWLFSGNVTSTSIPGSLRFQLNSRMFFYQASSDNKIFTVQEAYRVGNHMPVKINPVGVWSKGSGMVMTQEFLWERRGDLEGLTLKCAAAEDPPWVHIDPDQSTGIKVVGGYVYELWNELSNGLNMTTEFVRSTDGIFGVPMSNGSFNGMIGMLERKEIDCAIAGFGLTAQRAAVVDSINPIYQWKAATFIKTNGVKSDGSMTFVIPFTFSLYMFIVLTFVLCTVAFFATTNIAKDEDEEIDFTFGLSAMIIAHGLLLQGAPYEPNKSSSRIIFGSIFYAGMIIMIAYSASLTSLLAVKTEALPFKDFESFYEDSPYRMIGKENSAYTDHFRLGFGAKRKIFEEKYEYAPTLTRAIEILDTKENMAIYSDMQVIIHYTEGSCDYKRVPGMSQTGPLTFFLAKNSSYTALINYQLSKVVESGMLDKIAHKWIPEESQDCAINEAEPLGIDMLYTLFVLVAFALAICIILLVLEVFLYQIFKATKAKCLLKQFHVT